MREIKFRGWNKVHKHMTYDLCSSEQRHTLVWELMQYTGLKDKNGTEIYEGDICEYEDGEYSFIAIVEPDYVNWFLKGVSPKDNFNINGFHDCGKSWLEIIGNIYENPELLEGEE